MAFSPVSWEKSSTILTSFKAALTVKVIYTLQYIVCSLHYFCRRVLTEALLTCSKGIWDFKTVSCLYRYCYAQNAREKSPLQDRHTQTYLVMPMVIWYTCCVLIFKKGRGAKRLSIIRMLSVILVWKYSHLEFYDKFLLGCKKKIIKYFQCCWKLRRNLNILCS